MLDFKDVTLMYLDNENEIKLKLDTVFIDSPVNKTKTIIKEKNPMYNFLFINTILTLIYILIYALRLIGICIENDYYCSPLNETKFNIYYKTIFILFCGETLKTIFNFSYLSFSLSRYIKVTSSKLSFLLKFDRLKKRYYFFISLIIAVFINLYHLFEYNFNLSKLPDYFDSIAVEILGCFS